MSAVTVIAIDPGYAKRGRGCAVARFDDRVLRDVWYARPDGDVERLRASDAGEVVWECPQLDARSRVNASSVVALAAVGGVLAGLYAGASGCRALAVTPNDWKGSTPKPVAHARLWALLTYWERAVLGGDATGMLIADAQRRGALDRWGHDGASYYGKSAAATVHNLLDAAALGAWRVGRLPR